MKPLLQTPALTLGADETTGAISSFQLYGRELLGAGGCELQINGRALDLKPTAPTWTNLAPYPGAITGDALNEMHGAHFITHYTGYAFDVTRALRAVRAGEVHLAYTLQRTKIRALYEAPGPGWGALEAPLWAESLTLPCWNWQLWGEQTQMIALNTGNSGPSCHLGYENGPLHEVRSTVNHFFRRQYGGDLGFPGAVFYDGQSENWLAISCRRPKLAYQLNYEAASNGVAFEFLPWCEIEMSQSIALPEIVLHCGQSRAEMREFLAQFLSTFYQEPPAWFGQTTWFELSLGREYFKSWQEAERAATHLVEGGGVSGLLMLPHARHLAFGGTSPLGAGPLHELGNRRDFETMVKSLKARGTRLLFWMSTCGMTPGGDADPDWFVRGRDGDRLCAWGLPHHPDIFYVNAGHPGYRAYVEKWLHYYLGELGFDGVLFDCAGFAYPPDFAPRGWMNYPSDTLLSSITFFDWARETISHINPDAVVVTEGACLDAFSNALLLNSNAPAKNDGLGQRDFLLSLRNHGGARFVLRSDFEGDVGAGMAMVQPHANFAASPDGAAMAPQQYAAVGADAYNVLLTRLVREHGTREARTLGGGVSLLGRLLFVPQPRRENRAPAALVPVARGAEDADGTRVRLPPEFGGVRAVKSLLSGETVERRDGAFTFVARGIYEI